MKRPTVATSVLSMVSVLIAACPLCLLLLILPPQDILRNYEDVGARLPTLSAPFVRLVNLPLLIGLTIAVLGMLPLLEWRTQSERRRFVGQIGLIVAWQLVMLITFLGYSLATFKMGEVVTDEMMKVRDELRIRHKASQQSVAPLPRDPQTGHSDGDG